MLLVFVKITSVSIITMTHNVLFLLRKMIQNCSGGLEENCASVCSCIKCMFVICNSWFVKYELKNVDTYENWRHDGEGTFSD